MEKDTQVKRAQQRMEVKREYGIFSEWRVIYCVYSVGSYIWIELSYMGSGHVSRGQIMKVFNICILSCE